MTDEKNTEEKEEPFRLPCGVLQGGKVYRNIRLEPMTGAVLKAIGKREVRTNPARIINIVLSQSLVEVEGVDAVTRQVLDDMLVADRDYCFFKARQVTFGPTVEQITTCPHCEQKTDIEVDLSKDLKFKELTEKDYKVDGQNRVFTLNSPPKARQPWRVRFRYPTGSDQQVIAKIQVENVFEAEQHTLWRCLMKWDDNEGPFKKDFFEHIRLDTFNDVHAAFKDAQPGLVKMATTVCPYCGDEFTVDLGPSFLLQTSQQRRA